MNVFRFLSFGRMRQLARKPWMKWPMRVIGVLAFFAVVWFGGPLIGYGFEKIWVRLAIIGGFIAILLLIWFIRWRRARKAAAELEDAIIPDVPVGDGAVLAEKMRDALEVMKKSGGKNYLYDLPWYVIIGPPGSGKTTALLNSGIKFPLADKEGGQVEGFGGTRYTDWWFSEEAVMIDTAGRYTTQDSDSEADKLSWEAFLELLKKSRPKQPVNGVILAISVEDLMNGTDGSLDMHAQTIRARLAEVHETLKIDFPVYVMFTKADLVAGFREYFASFSMSRRQKVWGATFQTKQRGEQTHEMVGEEFDALVSRLADETMDRLSEEPDGVSRISIFGLPGQMALLKPKVERLLGAVFEPTRYKTNAMLRGFYFTSGTQEGTPIDQVLGEMGRSFGGEQAAMGGFMSGKGKSFFLHDLLTQVIFVEQGWVGFDRKAVMRAATLRYVGLGIIAAVTLGLLGGWGYSFWQNREMVAAARASMAQYESAAKDELSKVVIEDIDLLEVSSHLDILRDMETGYADDEKATGRPWEGFGLSQRYALSQSTQESYSDGLERMFRPRLILRLEEQLTDFVNTGETLAIYEGLKVYKILGGHVSRDGDDLIRAWFYQEWEENLYPGPAMRPVRESLAVHLDAMLELDGDRDVQVELDAEVIDESERILARMTVADQAWSLISATAEFSGVPDLNLVEALGLDSTIVFETVDGSELADMRIPSLYTYSGFHDFFLDQLSEVAKKLDEEKWVLGQYAETADVAGQMGGLGRALLTRYRNEFVKEWYAVLGNLKLAPMSADKPAYQALGAASSAATSPLLKLVEMVERETMLTREDEATSLLGEVEEGVEGGTSVVSDAQQILVQRLQARSSGLQRIGIDLALRNKSQRRAGAAGGEEAIIPGASVEAEFRVWHALLTGNPPSRPIDALLANFGAVRQNLVIAAGYNAAQSAANIPVQIGALRSTASRLPDPLSRMVIEAVQDFEGDQVNTTIAQLNQDLTNQVTAQCEDIIGGRYPFSGAPSRQVPVAQFARLFAPDGILDRYFLQNLSQHANVTGDEWSWREDSPIGDRLSLGALKQFQRAAAIRDAFFPLGGQNPEVEVTISQTSMHAQVQQAVLEVNGQVITTRQVGNLPQTVKWPSAGGSATLQLLPNMPNRASAIKFDNGPWAFLQFVRQGSPRLRGDTLRVRYVVGGRDISYEMRVNGLTNPFVMRELGEFKCPTGL